MQGEGNPVDVEGAPRPGYWKRHRIAAMALISSAVFTAMTVLAAPYPQTNGPAGMAIMAAFSMGIGFPILWALLTLEKRLASHRRERQRARRASSRPLKATGPEVAPFRWSGRTLRQAVPVLLAVAILASLVALSMYGQGPEGIAGDFFLAFLVLFVGLCALGLLYSARTKTYSIDASGIHVNRGWGANLDVHWSELCEIGIAKMPFSEWYAPFATSDLPKMFILRDRDGRTAGFLQPRGEIPFDVVDSLEEALTLHAATYGVPLREVGYREMMTWRRRRATPVGPGRVP